LGKLDQPHGYMN